MIKSNSKKAKNLKQEVKIGDKIKFQNLPKIWILQILDFNIQILVLKMLWIYLEKQYGRCCSVRFRKIRNTRDFIIWYKPWLKERFKSMLKETLTCNGWLKKKKKKVNGKIMNQLKKWWIKNYLQLPVEINLSIQSRKFMAKEFQMSNS